MLINPPAGADFAILAKQLTGKTGDAQIDFPTKKPYALSINMGGNDVRLVAIVYKKN